MNASLRHLAIRLWGTVLCGAVACLLVLPFWQSMLNVSWAVVPAAMLLLICFFVLGWLMNRLGAIRIQRLLKEAAVWERAGAADTAETVFERAIAVLDSFWLSPLGRRLAEEQVSPRLARFYLGQPEPSTYGRSLIHRYLRRHPYDVVLARSWLEQLPGHSRADAQDDELAAFIGDVLADDPAIQLLLMQYYLADQRCDFEAVQTYRRTERLHSDLPESNLLALAHILLKNNQLNDWALQIYLKGYDRGDPYCLEGIAAAVRLQRPHPGNRQALEQARRLTQTLDTQWQEKAARRFRLEPLKSGARLGEGRPPQISADKWPIAAPKPESKTGYARPGLALSGRSAGRAIQRVISESAQGLGRISRPIQRIHWQPGLLITSIILAAAIALTVGLRVFREDHVPIMENIPSEQAPLPPAELPFTIQVAAYLNPDDAQRYVALLQKQGLDAFSTQAVSAQRKWFQVKVSRFETKLQAREYGEKLKNSGIIDDFYVANYQQR